LRGIVEYAKQYQRVARVVFGEIRFIEAEAERDTAHQRVAKLGHRGHIFQRGLAESGDVCRKKIRAVHRDAGARHRVVISKLRAEIYAFFQIGQARSQFASDGEIAAPGSAPAGHPNFHLRFKVLSEESPAEIFQPLLQAFIHAMPDDVKESALATCAPDLVRHDVTTFRPADQRADVTDCNARDLFQLFHMTIPVLSLSNGSTGDSARR